METSSFGALSDGEGQVTDFIRLVNITKSHHAWRAVDREGKVTNEKNNCQVVTVVRQGKVMNKNHCEVTNVNQKLGPNS